jgi:hypothetical protein
VLDRPSGTARYDLSVHTASGGLGQQKLQSEVETLVMTLRNEGEVRIFVNL